MDIGRFVNRFSQKNTKKTKLFANSSNYAENFAKNRKKSDFFAQILTNPLDFSFFRKRKNNRANRLQNAQKNRFRVFFPPFFT